MVTSDDVSRRGRFVKRTFRLTPQRQSLATASRFAQLLPTLESRSALFGIPGVVLFVLGYRLSGDLASMFTELNTTSIAMLITIAMTLIGLFAMMAALILHIMGKQVARIQNQYNWPRRVDGLGTLFALIWTGSSLTISPPGNSFTTNLVSQTMSPFPLQLRAAERVGKIELGLGLIKAATDGSITDEELRFDGRHANDERLA